MQSGDRDAEKAMEGAVLLLLHSEDNRRALRKLLNLSVDLKLPNTFRALLGRLEQVPQGPT
jgi:hypothetical protein